VTVQDPIDSYQISGSLMQAMGRHVRLTGTADYFSSLASQQRYQQGIYAATNRTRRYGLNALANFGATTLSGSIEHNETFANANTEASNVIGSLPRVTFSRAEKRIGSLPIYYGSTSEFVTLVRTDKSANRVNERGLTRIDVFPTLRFPFTKWPFLTFNTAFGFRETYWTESLDNAGTRVPDPIERHYFTLSSTITGPVFTRVWNTPKRTYAQKFKHVIEPTFRISRVTPIDNYSNIVQLDNTDYVVGQVTSFQYGLNNRIYAKREVAREILSVAVTQSYYTDAKAAAVDREYQSSSYNTNPRPNHFSPIALMVRANPTPETDATFRTEYDTQFHALRTLAANGGIRAGWVIASGGWSQTREIPGIAALASHFLNAAAIVRRPGGALTGTYIFNYDVKEQSFVNQRLIAGYNTQCCGLAFEYQKFNYGRATSAVGVPQDRRFNISFTLAGIGTFSDIFGAFGGQQSR
jgi:hypothetical protein